MKRRFHPEPERHLGVRVVPANHEDDGVQREQRKHERRERKAPSQREHERDADDRGEDFEDPGEVIVRMDQRPDEYREEENEQDAVRHAGSVIRRLTQMYADRSATSSSSTSLSTSSKKTSLRMTSSSSTSSMISLMTIFSKTTSSTALSRLRG